MRQVPSTDWIEQPDPTLTGPPGEPVQEGSAAELRPEAMSDTQRPVVLIATAQLQVRAVGSTVLGAAGFQVETASCGETILAELESRRLDVIVVDKSLDDMDAVRFCSLVRRLPAGKTLPILVMSDPSDTESIQGILAEELTDIISAPANWKILTFRLHRWISMARRLRSLSDQEFDLEEVRESALTASTELLQLRNYDSVTGLPNREMFVSTAGLVLAQSQRSSGYCAVLYLDIDDFKAVNDLIGRSLGDELLRIVAKRLQGCLRAADLVSQVGDEEGSLASFARLIEDQFAILLGNVQDQQAAAVVAKRLLESLGRRLKIGGHQFRLSARIGIADSSNLDGVGEEELLQQAEIAMRYCKQRKGKTHAFYESFMSELVMKKLEIKAELRQALDQQQLFLTYQLLVDSRTADPTGVEGLVRWQHPSRGLVTPNEFLPVAEESDLILEIDRWVLRAGCRQGKQWLDKGYPPLLISLNVSMRFLAEEDFAAQVLAIVEETGLPPSSLQLELSERGNLPDAGRIASQFETLVAKGIHLALDDFGTGQTSLKYLQNLPISCVKVDQSFISRIPGDSASVAIVTAISAMSHRLGLKVVAEGVETVDHWRFLSENEYDQLQGFLFSRPERPEELETGFRNLVDWRRLISPDAPSPKSSDSRLPPARAAGVLPTPDSRTSSPAKNGKAAPGPGELSAAGSPGGTPAQEASSQDASSRDQSPDDLSTGLEDREAADRGYLLQLARNDFLTQLYNRYSFDERLEHAVAHADRFGHKVALLLIDLDDFKYVNDTHGHAVGDALLVALAGRLKKLVRRVDTLARIGGDEFAVVLSEFQDVKHVAELASRLLSELAHPVDVEGRELRLTGSLGISVYPAGSTQAKDLLRQADLALYKAKNHGGNSIRFFAREMDWEVQRRLALARDLVGAVERGELFVEYQTQVELETSAIVGVEALLRWNHPTKGLIGPGRLIPIAESTGEIRSIGLWVIRSVCAQAKQWQSICGRDVRVSVNISPVQCRDSGFAETLVEALKENQLKPELLDLELNEKLLESLPQDMENSFRSLSELGVGLTLDNFGSGTSALEYFQRFRFDRLKIHQSLVRTICRRTDSASVLSGIVALACKMKVQIVAEGIEVAEEVEVLLAEGCEVGQGFLFSKPMSADAVSKLMSPSEVPPIPSAESPAPAGAVAPDQTPAIPLEPNDDLPASGRLMDLKPKSPAAAAAIYGAPLIETASGHFYVGSYAAAEPEKPWSRRIRRYLSAAAMLACCLYILPGRTAESVAFEQEDPLTVSEPVPTIDLSGAEPVAAALVAEATTAPAKTSPREAPEHRTAAVPAAPAPELVDLAQAWARAWSEQRVEDYLALYAADFRPPDDVPRGDWEAYRRNRILRPRSIEVDLSAIATEKISADRGRVSFDQLYRNDAFSDTVRKTLEVVRENDGWKILAERAES